MGVRVYKESKLPPLVVVGANHKSLSVKGRENLAAIGSTYESVQELAKTCDLDNLVVLSTCNRFECISFDWDQGQGLKNYLLEKSSESCSEEEVYLLKGEDAIQHFFKVVASLDSMVLGESQILGQVKEAYRTAVKAETVNKLIHKLFQFAFRIGKLVKSETAVSQKGVSISYIAVQLAKQIFDRLEDKSVLLIGSGEMSELALLHLQSYGCHNIFIANRTIKKAEILAKRVQGHAIGLGDISSVLPKVDVVIGSIAVSVPVIQSADVRGLEGRNVFFIDCGLPRNFHPSIADYDGVYLYNIDDLQEIANKNSELRIEAAKDAELIVNFGVNRFMQWLTRVEWEPYLLDFRRYVKKVCKDELSDRDILQLSNLDRTVHKLVEQISYGMQQVLLQSEYSALVDLLEEDFNFVVNEK